MNGNDSLVRVGDIARATGLTVRALHHYEDVGLLAPIERTPAGHRLYGTAAVERLYRIGLLRRYGMSLDQIRRTLDDDRDPTHDLIQILEDMMNATLVKRRISILVYRDLDAAHRFLVDVFGFTPGEVTTDPDGNVVHAEVVAGDGTIWLHRETEEFGLASPATLGAATATMAIMVDDVDDHYRLVAEKVAEIVYPPVDQPYGYREYSVRDPEGALWSFMKPLEP